jgi:methylmalonyl-CoA mutase N-terminal domain/subunit
MSKNKFGKYPFEKGIYKNMYRDKLWTMRQYAGFSSVDESNKRYLKLIENGVSGLSVAFDLPTQMGYDSDDDMSFGEVGKSGVPISTIEDMERLFENINLEDISVSMTINSTAAILLAFYFAMAKKRGYNFDALRGTLQNDILKEYIARGTFIFPVNDSLRLTSNIFEFCQQNLSKWNSISISGYHIREAGSTAVQELAFTFANAITYLEKAKEDDLDLIKLTEQVSFFFNAHRDFFEEVAKFRAARIIWAQIIKNRFKIDNVKSQLCRFHVQTGGSTLTAQQIDNNIARTTLESLSAVFGGAQSIHTNGKDEAVSLPSEENATTALRIQQIIAHESGVANYIDPLGDSSVIKDLTNNIVKEVEMKIEEIFEKGGMKTLIERGEIQSEIEKSAFEFQEDIDSKKTIFVGVNKFINENEIIDSGTSFKDGSEDRLQRLNIFKEQRDNKIVKESLDKLVNVAKTSKNVMPQLITCVENNCTLGEIIIALKTVFGEYLE